MTDDSLILDIEEHPFAQYVRILGKGKKGSRSLSETEAYDAMSMILQGQALDLQIGSFLMLLRVKEESPEELSGFVKAVKANIQTPDSIEVDLDWSSYAGKRRHPPWFVFSVCLLAQMGFRVFIHGASGHTTQRMYTEDVFRRLGLPVCNDWDDCSEQLDNTGLSYAPLRTFSPVLAEMIDMRSILGLRSPVHSLARLINPLDAPNVLQGIFHPPYSHLHQQAAQKLGYSNLAVIKGEGGEIERNPDNAITVYHCRNKELAEEHWPALFPRRHVKPVEISIKHMINVWEGTTDDEYAVAAVTSTTALALRLMNGSTTQEQATKQAEEAWHARDTSRFSMRSP